MQDVILDLEKRVTKLREWRMDIVLLALHKLDEGADGYEQISSYIETKEAKQNKVKAM